MLLFSPNIFNFQRKLAKKILDVQDPDYYEWTTHIFFDDCMEPDDTGYEFQVQYCTFLSSIYL